MTAGAVTVRRHSSCGGCAGLPPPPSATANYRDEGRADVAVERIVHTKPSSAASPYPLGEQSALPHTVLQLLDALSAWTQLLFAFVAPLLYT
jgi:hypothetical protein